MQGEYMTNIEGAIPALSGVDANEGQPASRSRLTESEIASRAYERWKRRGCPDGSAEEDWLAAEQEIEVLDAVA
jgi:hypothetical protein